MTRPGLPGIDQLLAMAVSLGAGPDISVRVQRYCGRCDRPLRDGQRCCEPPCKGSPAPSLPEPEQIGRSTVCADEEK
jgi:hypothetical protein